MAVNIEIKARVHDFDRLCEKAKRISDTPCQVIPQEDTFFNCPQGRLKLRELSPRHGQLVYYRRADIHGPKHSDYTIFETNQPAELKELLTAAYGVRGVVSKIRYLFMVGQTRIHLDKVKDLGEFMELEVVLKPSQSDTEGETIAKSLMQQLGIQEQDLIDSAYMDLFEK
jgi:predicted adenylyl cyclase CyaB